MIQVSSGVHIIAVAICAFVPAMDAVPRMSDTETRDRPRDQQSIHSIDSLNV
jgi:hypothetical protein